METLLRFLSENKKIVFIVIGVIIALFIIAVIQGREVSFWPPKIGPKVTHETPKKEELNSGTVKVTPSIQTSPEDETEAGRSPDEMRQSIEELIEELPQSSERHTWNSGDPNPDIAVDCWSTLTPNGYSVTHAGGTIFNVTFKFNAVGHCNRSIHPQGVPECNCNGPVSATAIIDVLKSGLLRVNEASANVHRCVCLEGRGSVYVEKTVKVFDNQSIGAGG